MKVFFVCLFSIKREFWLRLKSFSLRSSTKMKLSKCLEWNFKEFFFMCNDPSDSSKVTKFSCIICKELYGENKNELDKLKGKVKEMVVCWIEGTNVIKKCNAETHRASNVHTLAVQRLREKLALPKIMLISVFRSKKRKGEKNADANEDFAT